MTESKRKNPSNKTTVKVTPRLLLEINNEQNRLQNLGRSKVSQSDIMQSAFRMYKDSLTPELESIIPDPIGRYTDTEREWLRDFMLTGMTALEIAKGAYLGEDASDTGKHGVDSLIEDAREEENRAFKATGKRKAAGPLDPPNSKRIGR